MRKETDPLVVTPAELFVTVALSVIGSALLTLVLVGGLMLVERIFR